jgi:hypothetical protein
LLPAGLAVGVGSAAFLRRFRPRYTVGRSCARVTVPRSNVLYRHRLRRPAAPRAASS